MASNSRKIEWAPLAIAAMGVAIALYGARTFYMRGHFGLADLARCAALLIPAGLFLLVTSYVIQHARLVAVIPLLAGAVLVIGNPSFAVALGVVLVGAMAVPALQEWWASRAERGSSA